MSLTVFYSLNFKSVVFSVLRSNNNWSSINLCQLWLSWLCIHCFGQWTMKLDKSIGICKNLLFEVWNIYLICCFKNVIFYYRYNEKIRTLTKTVEDIKGSKNQAADENIKGLQKKIGSLESELRNATTE